MVEDAFAGDALHKARIDAAILRQADAPELPRFLLERVVEDGAGVDGLGPTGGADGRGPEQDQRVARFGILRHGPSVGELAVLGIPIAHPAAHTVDHVQVLPLAQGRVKFAVDHDGVAGHSRVLGFAAKFVRAPRIRVSVDVLAVSHRQSARELLDQVGQFRKRCERCGHEAEHAASAELLRGHAGPRRGREPHGPLAVGRASRAIMEVENDVVNPAIAGPDFQHGPRRVVVPEPERHLPRGMQLVALREELRRVSHRQTHSAGPARHVQPPQSAAHGGLSFRLEAKRRRVGLVVAAGQEQPVLGLGERPAIQYLCIASRAVVRAARRLQPEIDAVGADGD